ncbi:MAG: hypothetical protein IPK17_01585 [Chloroflexi bacterium]|uniref:hypothetical protein n=1 Tax=Candidatus Flexifilum breve TaxID=3140694 RepID=UPI003135C949|nr:hypothetical protein [Chloroflexota bacterium]
MRRGEQRILVGGTISALGFSVAALVVRDIDIWLLIVEVILGLLLIVWLQLIFMMIERNDRNE